MTHTEQKLKQSLRLGIILLIFIVLAFPDPRGRSLYAYNETLRDLGVTQSIAHGHLALLGPVSSLGNFHFGPAYYYLLYPFAKITNFALWSLPLASVFYGCLFILLIFFVVKKWWQNFEMAYLAAALAATSTLTVQFAKYASNPNFIPLFCLLFFYSLERLVGGTAKRYWQTFLLALSFGVAIQLHAVPLICLPVILIALFVSNRLKFSPAQWALFLAVILATNGMYIFYEITHNFENLKSLAHIGAGANIYAPFSEHFIQYLGFWVSSIISVNPFFNIPLILGIPFYTFFVMVLILFYAVFKYNHARLKPAAVKPQTQPSVKLVIKYWLIVPSLILLLPLGALAGLRIYYFFILSPLVFILLALGLWRLLYRGYGILVYYLLVVYFIMQAGQMYVYYQLVSQLR